MAKHAKLPPSAAHRWMNCAGSVALAGDDSTAGMEAMRGTAAHKVVETMIDNGERDAQLYFNKVIIVTEATGDAVILDEGAPAPIEAGKFMFVCDDVMTNGVQMMLDEVDRVFNEAFEPVIFSERFLDMTWLDSRLGGTADVTIVEFEGAGGTIHLFDYKNGRIVVEVRDNEQFLNYAVGLLHEHPGCNRVHIHLIQPNAPHEEGAIRDITYTADEIKLFELKLKAAADATTPANAPRRAGDWCVFCPAKERCPEFDAMVHEEAGFDFANDPVELPTPELIGENDAHLSNESGDFLIEQPNVVADADEYRAMLAHKAKFIPLLDSWVKQIRSKIQAELINGNVVSDGTVEGTWKLVEGKSNRAWKEDEAFTVSALVGKWQIPEEMLYHKPEFLSPAQVEKLRPPGFKPKTLKDAVKELAEKPRGKIVAAPGDDTRPAVDPSALAAADFADDPINDDDSDFR